MSAHPKQAAAEGVVSIRKTPGGPGQQYEIKWQGQSETTWEAASRVRRQIPALVAAFEQIQQQQIQLQQNSNDAMAEDEEGAADQEGAADGSSMRAQMEAMQQLVRDQAQQLQQLRASPQALPAHSPLPSPRQEAQSASASAIHQSRFARKEPRAQDLREYDGASGTKLDEWLQELQLAIFLYKLNALEASSFGVSRMRGAALQWWLSLDAAQQNALADPTTMAAALRARFQPVTAARVAREQLDRLQQGSRPINDYIADFQRLRTQLPTMAEEDALYAFERGLRRDLAEKLRVQGVSSVQDAIALAARVGSLMHASTIGRQAATAAQMEVDGDDGNGGVSRLDRIEAALNALTSAQSSSSGSSTKTQTQRGYQQENSRGGGRGGRGGRFGGRGGAVGGPPHIPHVAGVPTAIVEQRRAAGQCYRCGSADHTRFECTNASSVSHSSN
jgi:hypothetical protein